LPETLGRTGCIKDVAIRHKDTTVSIQSKKFVAQGYIWSWICVTRIKQLSREGEESSRSILTNWIGVRPLPRKHRYADW
jgi:hypothetical protein